MVLADDAHSHQGRSEIKSANQRTLVDRVLCVFRMHVADNVLISSSVCLVMQFFQHPVCGLEHLHVKRVTDEVAFDISDSVSRRHSFKEQS